MLELTSDQFNAALPLFKDITHRRVFVFSLFEGNHTGRVFVDQTPSPSVALLDLTCEFLCINGATDNAEFNSQLQALLSSKLQPANKYLFLIPFSDAWYTLLHEMFKDCNLMDITRNTFYLDRERFRVHAQWRGQVPVGFSVQQYDRALTESASGIREFWGSIDNFLAHGLGYAILHGDEIVSRCHTVLTGEGQMEISVETSEPYRWQGFATLATCAFIEHCLQAGLEPEWSCWSVNAASVALAEKLGFVRGEDVHIMFVRPK